MLGLKYEGVSSGGGEASIEGTVKALIDMMEALA